MQDNKEPNEKLSVDELTQQMQSSYASSSRNNKSSTQNYNSSSNQLQSSSGFSQIYNPRYDPSLYQDGQFDLERLWETLWQVGGYHPN